MPRNTSYTENDVQNAIEAVENGYSQMEAQRLYGVPRQTFHGRRCGAVSMAVAKERYQRLCRFREKYVCDWIRHTERNFGQRPSNEQIRDFASRLLPAQDSRPLGKNWIRGFLIRNPEAKPNRSSAGRVAFRLPHDSESSFHWNMARETQRTIFELARSDTRWTSPSKFDYEGAPQTYYILKCSMMHFKDDDHLNGGRMLRKAFVTLEHELSDGSLTVVQDVCLNILGVTLRFNYAEIGTRILRHCGHLFGLKHQNRLFCIFFESLAHVFCQDNAQLDSYLWELTKLYVNELDNVRSCNDRSSIQANRRHRLIPWNSEETAAAKDIISRSECLLVEAVSKFGNLHDKTLRIQNEALRMQSYFQEYRKEYIIEIRRTEKQLIDHYIHEQKIIPFESWEQAHQSAFLRLLEREFDYYKDIKDLDRAEEAARRLLKLEKYQTERWIMVSLQFEFWLRSMGQKRKSARIKEERLRSGYYSRLKESFQ